MALSDLDAVTAIHLAAFPDSALTKLGHEAIRRYYEWQMVGPHDAVNIGVFEDGQLLGFCFGGVFRGALGGFLEKNRDFLIRRVISRPWLILINPLFRERALFAARRVLKRPPPKSSSSNVSTNKSTPDRHFGILSIAVDPQFRGSGVAQLLMEYSEEAAKQRGFTRMGLTVHPSNTRAVRFYEKVGWKKDHVDGKWSGRMSKTLDSGSTLKKHTTR